MACELQESGREPGRDQVRDALEGGLYTALSAIVKNLNFTLNEVQICWKV